MACSFCRQERRTGGLDAGPRDCRAVRARAVGSSCHQDDIGPESRGLKFGHGVVSGSKCSGSLSGVEGKGRGDER